MNLLPVGQFYYPPRAPDMTRAGLERRLGALRAAIHYRNTETGRRHYCHLREYRAIWVATIRGLRAAIRLTH